MTKEIENYLAKHSFGQFEPKVVLFDMDGVLYNSMPNHAVAWTKSMERFGIKFTPADAYSTEGARGVDTIRIFMKRQKGLEITEEEAQRIYDVKTEIFQTLPKTKIFDGVTTLMQHIHEAGLTIGVVTGSGQRPLIERLLSDLGQWVSEEHIVTAYDVKRGKPAPDPYLTGLSKCGDFKPWQGIVVENAPLGIRSGVAAQCFTVGINSGPLPDSELLAERPDWLFHSIVEFEQHIDEILPRK